MSPRSDAFDTADEEDGLDSTASYAVAWSLHGKTYSVVGVRINRRAGYLVRPVPGRKKQIREGCDGGIRTNSPSEHGCFEYILWGMGTISNKSAGI
jgi:hypothetical protein